MLTSPATEAELDALAADCAEVLLDLPSLGYLVEIKTKASGKVPFGWETWHPEQRRFHAQRTGRDIVLKPRQIGFSTLEVLRDIQFARTHEGVQVVIVVHTEKAKTELFSAAHLMVRALVALGLAPEPSECTKHSIRWDDIDSSIQIIEAGKDDKTAANRGRSGTIHRLHMTEAAFYSAADETATALFAALGDNECVIESTANGVGNWFHTKYQAARDGAFDFQSHFFPWYEHPEYVADPAVYSRGPKTRREAHWEAELLDIGCSDEQIAWWRRQVEKTDLDRTLQEYPPTPDAAFRVSGETWLEPEHLDRLRAGVRQPVERRLLKLGEQKHGELRIYEYPVPGESYIIAADPSEGGGGDEAALVIMHHQSGRFVAAWDHARTKAASLGLLLNDVGRMYNTALVAVERQEWRGGGSRGGKTTLAELSKVYPRSRIYHDEKGAIGWSTDGSTRPLLWGELAKAIEHGLVDSPDAKTVGEAASIVVGDDGRPAARKKGKRKSDSADDGLFVSWGIAWQVRARSRPPGAPVIARPVGARRAHKFRT